MAEAHDAYHGNSNDGWTLSCGRPCTSECQPADTTASTIDGAGRTTGCLARGRLRKVRGGVGRGGCATLVPSIQRGGESKHAFAGH